MNSLKLSVIIPIHNADRLLSSCLESIRNQSFSDYEVLCIDDNSTDNSSEIIKNFASTDARFKYLKINERSASKARNYGMDIAQGEFITFVDADDFVEQNAFEYLLSSIETNAGTGSRRYT